MSRESGSIGASASPCHSTLIPMSHPPSPSGPTLGRRLLATFFVVLLLGLIGSSIGLWSLYRVDGATGQMVQQNVATERLVADAYRHQENNAARYKAMALSSEPEVGDILGADISATQQSLDALMKQLASRLQTAQDRALMARTEDASKDFERAKTELLAARDSGLTERIKKVYSERFLPSSNAQLAAVAALAESQRQAIDDAASMIALWSLRACIALVAFSVAAMVVGGALSLWLVRSISRPIQLASETADRVASLDLRLDIEGHSRDETGRLLTSLSVMQEALRALVRQVRGSTQNVSSASSEIASGNADLSNRTEQAASSLQQTAASLEQMTQAVRQSAEAAHRAEDLASSAATLALEGGAAVAQMVKTMQEIQQSSRQIEDIINVIDGIAFQTNILALNAAVEAARAGEQGRGFSVVAAEVRSLATRSGHAARAIKTLIDASVRRVGTGTHLVGQAGQTMTRIVNAIQTVAHTIGEIKGATHTQNHDIAQINDAVSLLDRMTQQNTALVEESAAASESLRSQAQELQALISRFVLPEPSLGIEVGRSTHVQKLSWLA